MENFLRSLYTIMVVLALTIIAMLLFLRGELIGRLEPILWFTLGAAVVSFLIYIRFVTTKNPTTLPLAIVGYPNAGKTVYLSVLFNELSQNKLNAIRFTPYGTETIENVATNMGMLLGGKWLPRTAAGSTFYFRGNITMETELFGMVRRSYKLEIADYAGEYTGELVAGSDRWLHKTDYFKQVIQSDGIFLAMDTDFLMTKTRQQIEDMQSDFMAAIHVLAAEKGGTEIKKVSTPLALVFLKIDVIQDKRTSNELTDRITSIESRLAALNAQLIPLVENMPEESLKKNQITTSLMNEQNKLLEEIKQQYAKLRQEQEDKFEDVGARIANLMKICRQRFSNFEVFKVTSVGFLGPNAQPPDKFEPDGVVDPLVWILGKI